MERDRSAAAVRRPLWSQAWYRVGQFLHGAGARVAVQERRQAEAWLPPAAAVLFESMPVDAQRHSLNVLRTLQNAGYDHPDLAAAALLHDAGKAAADAAGVRLNLWWRGPLVLWEWAAPGLLRRQAVANPARGWRYALYVHVEHPRIGARWAETAGCTALTCWLIEHHQDKALPAGDEERRRLLAALQQADERN